MKPVYSLLIAALAAVWFTSAIAADAPFVDAKVVAQAQKILNDRGFRTGGVDGKMGPQTQAALVNFQRAEKLQPSGKLDGPTLTKLGLNKENGSANAERFGEATIRRVQQTLNARGYEAGPVNGTLGESTQRALRAFQKAENLQVTGNLNPRTLKALGIEDAGASTGGTRAGAASTGTIRDVQLKLAERGYRPGPADGVLGRATRAALTQFQRQENLPQTGRADSATLAALGVKAG
jgi:peptidoglycan hydrolase-like protein with peptidoglycan-binding domain